MKTTEENKCGMECIRTNADRSCVKPEKGQCPRCKQLVDEFIARIQQLESRLAQVERERDAMSYDMHQLQGALCAYCKNLYRPKDALQVTCSVFGDGYGDRADSPLICGSFKWRGVCEENSKENSQDENH